MTSTATDPLRPRLGSCRSIALLVLAISVIGGMNANLPAHAAGTGVRGTVLWGPTAPGPAEPGQPDDAPLSASFTVYAAGRAVASFRSDDQGCFEVSLPPGEYTIAPQKGTPVPNPERQKTSVTVPDDGYAVVTIRLDTGMK